MKTFLKSLLMLVLACTSLLGQEIQAGKSVMISISGVLGDEKVRIDGPYRVADNGTIRMPYIGAVRAAGLKPETLAASLEAQYRGAQIYRDPTFQVVSDREGGEVDEAKVVIGGNVARPGPVKYQRGLTLWQAIQSAGGQTPFGTIRRVMVTRAGKQREYDLREVRNMNIQLEPDDAIQVPQKKPWETT